jgi:hypothetical protein
MVQRKHWFIRWSVHAILISAGLSVMACSGSGTTTFSASGSGVPASGSPSPSPTPSPSPSPSPPPSSSYTLTVGKTGSGTVLSNVAGINCGSSCSATYNSGTSVTLTATAGGGYVFSGWSGVCSGTGSCVVTMSQARSVTAIFSQSGVVDLNCTGTWTGSEETTNITAWPHRDCFRTNPVGTRCGSGLGAGDRVEWPECPTCPSSGREYWTDGSSRAGVCRFG